MDKYILYSNHNTGVHVFMRTTPDGKESVVSSEEMRTYKKGQQFNSIMDIHHALVRFTFEQVPEPEGKEMDAINDILRVPFEKASEIVSDDKQQIPNI